jgi:2-oxoglutarate dehydrogenase E1 component
VLPLLIHGDAAFAGQGVVMETLALSQTRGYKTGGTVHIVVNNQIGFTTSDTRDARSSLYCTDIAKMIEAPVFHVNGDDPEAVVMVARVALDYRRTFHKDVVIDLVCFRRLGHNEQDEPFVTQPLMYKKIAQHPGTRKLYSDKLEKEGVIAAGQGDEMVTSVRTALDAGKGTNAKILYGLKPKLLVDWAPFVGVEWSRPADTALPLEKLKALAKRLTEIPANFKLHPTVERLLAGRRGHGRRQDGPRLGHGGEPRLTRASSTRSIRCVLGAGRRARDFLASPRRCSTTRTARKWDSGVYIPLQNISEGQANFVIIDSLLSEEAVLAFEYGYATAQPFELVIWEAQFGDFVNGAQVVIDQFIAAGEAEVGAAFAGSQCSCRTATKARAPSTLRRGSSASCNLCRAQHPGVRTIHARSVLPHAAAPDHPPDEEAPDRDDAEEPAAQEGVRLAARRSRQGRIPGRHPRGRESRRERR